MEFLEARDQGIWNGIQSIRKPWLDTAMIVLGFLGRWEVLLVLVVVAAVYFLRRGQPRQALWVGGAYGVAWALLYSIREVVGRDRPQVFRNPLEIAAATPGFPSERTLLATATYITIALALGVPGRRGRDVVASGALISLGVGVSRLFAGVCYPTDILAGWLAGLLVVLAFQALMDRPSAVQ